MRATFALLASLLVASCAGETVEMPPSPPVNWQSLNAPPPLPPDGGKLSATEKERATAAVYLQALASPKLAQLGAVLDEEAHFAYAGVKDAHGREQVVKAHDALFGAYDQRSFTATRLWLTDSAQALEWFMSGVQAGKRVTIRGLTLLWTKDDGSIADVHVYFDEAAVKRLPPPPAPDGTRQDYEQTGSAVEAANVAHVRGAIDALEKTTDTDYVAAMADDVEVHTLERQPARGKAQARAYFNDMHKSIAYLDSSILYIWGVQQFVVAEYSIVGEQRGPIGWIPAQPNNVVKISMVDLVELRDGKIARVWRYDNPSQILSSP